MTIVECLPSVSSRIISHHFIENLYEGIFISASSRIIFLLSFVKVNVIIMIIHLNEITI